jgi:hypothetical protein
MKTNKIFLFIIVVIISLLSISNCKSNEISTTSFNSVVEVQKIIPFKIVLPEYLPANLRNELPLCIYQGQAPLSENSALISIYYSQLENSVNWILIDEQNVIFTIATSDTSVFLDIRGVTVLEEPTNTAIIPEGSVLNGLLYNWDNNGIQFTVRIFGYDKYECRKVIESMIK